VKNALLHGDLKEEVYMEVPLGLEDSDSSSIGKVCKLKKVLYGLKQFLRAWFKQFSWAIQRFDHTLFIKHSFQWQVTVLIVYVDDIIVIGNEDEEIPKLKKSLAHKFGIKDLGYLKYL
jgi:hypothetical protein